MKNKKALLPLLVLAAVAVLAAVILNARRTVERGAAVSVAPLVQVQSVELTDTALIVRGQGSATAAIDTVLVAEVAGTVDAIGVGFADGAGFHRGDLLVQIDRRDYVLVVAQAEANVAQARVRLDRERAEAELARSEWEELGLEGEASPLAVREPQLAEAEAQLAATEASLEKARLSLSRTTISAPFSGRTRRKLVDLGQYVTPGTPLADVFSASYSEVPLPIPQSSLAFLETQIEGATVSFRGTIGGEERFWIGRIVRTAEEIDARTRMMTLYARIDDPMSLGDTRPRSLPMGAFLEAEISGRVASEVASLPRTALRDGDRVLVIDDENRLRFRAVNVLRKQDDRVLIDGGLETGERVCTSAIEAPVDGMEVRVMPIAVAAEDRL